MMYNEISIGNDNSGPYPGINGDAQSVRLIKGDYASNIADIEYKFKPA